MAVHREKSEKWQKTVHICSRNKKMTENLKKYRKLLAKTRWGGKLEMVYSY